MRLKERVESDVSSRQADIGYMYIVITYESMEREVIESNQESNRFIISQ